MRNRHFWRQDGGYRDWIEFFFGQQLPEPHSTKQYEDTVGWALDTDAEAMIAETGRAGRPAGEARPRRCAAGCGARCASCTAPMTAASRWPGDGGWPS